MTVPTGPPILLVPTRSESGPREARRSIAGMGYMMEILVVVFVATGSAVVAYMFWRWRSALAEVASGLEALGAGRKCARS